MGREYDSTSSILELTSITTKISKPNIDDLSISSPLDLSHNSKSIYIFLMNFKLNYNYFTPMVGV